MQRSHGLTLAEVTAQIIQKELVGDERINAYAAYLLQGGTQTKPNLDGPLFDTLYIPPNMRGRADLRKALTDAIAKNGEDDTVFLDQRFIAHLTLSTLTSVLAIKMTEKVHGVQNAHTQDRMAGCLEGLCILASSLHMANFHESRHDEIMKKPESRPQFYANLLDAVAGTFQHLTYNPVITEDKNFPPVLQTANKGVAVRYCSELKKSIDAVFGKGKQPSDRDRNRLTELCGAFDNVPRMAKAMESSGATSSLRFVGQITAPHAIEVGGPPAKPSHRVTLHPAIAEVIAARTRNPKS